MNESNFVVWVGGVEVNDYLLTEKQAQALAADYTSQGYEDVQIERVDHANR